MRKNFIALMATAFAAVQTTALKAGTVDSVIRGNAKFNVVVIVLVIIFIGISLFLFRLDRRLTQLEKQEKKN